MTTFRFALVTVFFVFLLLIVGGMVNPTGSSLACPDWPLCYGHLMPSAEDITNPDMVDNVFFEHGHRTVATLVGLLTIILAILIHRDPRSKEQKDLRKLGYIAVFLVILQGVLGGVTVLLKLPMAVSSAHLALAMFFFCFTIYIAFRLWPGRIVEGNTRAFVAPRAWAMIAGLFVYSQIFLGALVRHTESGRACGQEIPFCGPDVWPSWGPAQLHMLHRYWGILAFTMVVIMAFRVAKVTQTYEKPFANKIVWLLPALGVVQVVLGFLTVTTSISVPIVTAHLAIGALMLGGCWAVYLGLGPQADRVRRA